MFLGKVVLKIYSKFKGERPCRSVISGRLQSNSVKIIFWHRYSRLILLHIFKIPFPKKTPGGLLLLRCVTVL